MWKDKAKERYPWAKIKNQLDELIYELSKAEDEEEVELSMLRLHAGNKIDFEFFTPEEAGKVKKLLAILIKDTQRHQALLSGAVEELEKKKKMGETEIQNDESWSI